MIETFRHIVVFSFLSLASAFLLTLIIKAIACPRIDSMCVYNLYGAMEE